MTRSSQPSAPSVGWIVCVGLLTVVLAYLPVFLFTGLGTHIRQTLSLSAVWLGIGAAVFFAASAIAAALVGVLCNRFGGVAVLRMGSLLSAVALIVMALGNFSIWLISVGLVIGGVANGLSQTAANVVLYEFIRHEWQGRVFAIKQSAAPAVTFVAGFVVAVLVPRFSWELVFATTAVLFYLPTLVLSRKVPRRSTARSRVARQRFRLRAEPSMFLLAFASFLSFGAATAAVAYFVETLATNGVDLALAGQLLMAGSLAGVIMRITVGIVLDKLDLAPLLVCLVMMTVGATGLILVVDATSLALLVLATVLVFAAGWGWPGLFVLGVVRSFPDKAGWASSMIQFGSALGAAAGPFLFGSAFATFGPRAAWWAAAAALTVSAAAIYSRHRINTRLAARSS